MEKIRKLSNIKMREARIAAGLGTVEFAQKVGVTSPTISYYEIGIRTPNANILCRIADALCVKMDDLFETTD